MAVHVIEAIFKSNMVGYTPGVAAAVTETKALTAATGGSIQNLERVETSLSKAGGASYAFSRKLYGLQGVTQAFTGGAEKGFLGMSGAATVGFAAAGAAAVAFGAASVKAYNEHNEALIQLNEAIGRSPALLGASAEAFDKQADAIQRSTGANRDSILAADATLARFKLTSAEITRLNPLIADYAHITGQDLPTAAGNFGRSLLGNARALKAIGIQFKATGDTEKDVATITGLLEQKVGGAAEAFGKTLPGQVAILKGEFHDLEIEAGQLLVPALTSVVHGLTVLFDVVGWVGRGIGTFTHGWFAWLNPIGQIVKTMGLLGRVTGQVGHDNADFASKLQSTIIPSWDHLTKAQQAQVIAMGKLAGIDVHSLLVQYGKDQELAARQTAAAVSAQKAAIQGLDFYVQGVGRVGDILHRFATVSGQDWDKFKQSAIDAAVQGAAAQDKFVAQVTADYQKWHDSVAAQFSDTSSLFTDLANDTELTGAKINKALADQLRSIHDFSSAFNQLVKEGAPDALLQQFQQLGLQAVPVMQAIAGESKDMRDKTFRQFNQIQRDSSTLADHLERVLIGAINDLIAAIESIPGWHNTHLTVTDAQALADLSAFQQHLNELSSTGVITIGLATDTSLHGGRRWGGPIGTLVPFHAQTGRMLPGYGGGDRIPLMGEGGEYVWNKEAVKRFGPFIDWANSAARGSSPAPMPVMTSAASSAPSPGIDYGQLAVALAHLQPSQGDTNIYRVERDQEIVDKLRILRRKRV